MLATLIVDTYKSDSKSMSSTMSTLSSDAISGIVEKLKSERCRSSTCKTYHAIWKVFGKFYSRLDKKPIEWVDKLVLFAGYLIEVCKLQSQTVKTYLSAIKAVLAEDGIQIESDNFVLRSLTHACKLKNDRIITHFPIHRDVLNLILKETKKYFSSQPYLLCMYLALFSTAYFGLLPIGELTAGPHVITVCNVHVGTNKHKVLFILRTSKTHNKGDKPQRVKIARLGCKTSLTKSSLPCPFQSLRDFISFRPKALHLDEQFFVFSDGSILTQSQARETLKLHIKRIGLDERAYNFHSLRIGRGGDLLKLGLSVETIKKLGSWKSNAVFACLRD